MYKMYLLNLPSNFLRLLCSFLTDRTLRVHVEGSISRLINLAAGTPRGSCISPILFNIHVNDIPFDQMLQLHCHPSQFADDTGIYGSGEDAQMVANNVQKSLNVMEKWCTKWRINLCHIVHKVPHKTQITYANTPSVS